MKHDLNLMYKIAADVAAGRGCDGYTPEMKSMYYRMESELDVARRDVPGAYVGLPPGVDGMPSAGMRTDWEESEHPREGGKFATKGGEEGAKAEAKPEPEVKHAKPKAKPKKAAAPESAPAERAAGHAEHATEAAEKLKHAVARHVPHEIVAKAHVAKALAHAAAAKESAKKAVSAKSEAAAEKHEHKAKEHAEHAAGEHDKLREHAEHEAGEGGHASPWLGFLKLLMGTPKR